jgi:hypothetical protein
MREWLARRLRKAAEHLSPSPPSIVQFQQPNPVLGRIAKALEDLVYEQSTANRLAQRVKEGPQIAAVIAESQEMGADDSAILMELRDRLRNGWY